MVSIEPEASAELRIVSLIPSATEIVAKLGYSQYLVGRSHECDFPSSVTTLPICTEPKFDPVGTSAEIHDRVTNLLTSALSVYRVKTDLLAELRPTHIITQAQCEVCAVSLSDVKQAVTDLMKSNAAEVNQPPIQIVSLQPECLADLWTDMQRVANALQTSPQTTSPQVTSSQSASSNAADIISTLKTRIHPIKPSQTPPKVACIEWTEPLMAAGNWVPELVALAGGHDCLGQAGQHSDWMTWDDLQAADPDIIVVLPCGYDLAQTRQATLEIAAHPKWQQLSAVKNNLVYLTDGNQYFNRPGPRLVDSWEILVEIIQKTPINSDRHSVGWETL